MAERWPHGCTLKPRLTVRFSFKYFNSEIHMEVILFLFTMLTLELGWRGLVGVGSCSEPNLLCLAKGEGLDMKRYLIFAVLGPLLGGFLLLLATTYMSGYWNQPNASDVEKLLGVFFRTLQYSYLFGILPALMLAAVDDILFHLKSIGWGLRLLMVGAIAFIAAELLYGSRGSDSGAIQFMLYGLVGFVPATVSSFLSHEAIGEPARA